ncbi:MAG: hypothetical protein K9N49_03555 [Candidatus Marinimicrobia bacterium]|nr:hypothetical protein [Candidatus Neomarinimicrobiota bacterium]
MLAPFSILSIGLAIAIGYFRRVNIGLVSIAFAFAIGHFLADVPPGQIINGWPMSLFFMLLGITLLFGIARANGSLGLIARRIVGATRGRTRLIPPVFFVMSGVLAALGAGNIAVCALVLPIAMTVAVDYRISPLLMATLTIAGANAGGLSPVAPTGIIALTLARESHVDIGLRVFYRQIIGQCLLATTVYFLFRGHRLRNQPPAAPGPAEPFTPAHWATIAVFLIVVAGIVFGGWNIGLTAFTGAVILLFLRVADEQQAIQSVPWSTLILVSGVGMLVRVCEGVGGIDLLAHWLTKLMNAQTAAPILAVIGGVLSIVSSASGVVMPTLIPTVPGLVAEIGGDATRMISAIIIGAHVVTNSPISTLGALAVASAGAEIDKATLFKNLFLFALAGLIYAALLVYIGVV